MVDSDIHINDFYHDAAKALVVLYKHFPRKTMLYVEDISGPDTPDEFGLHSTRHEACFNTLLWLAHGDYLRYEHTVRQEAIDQAVLSHRGFLLLNAPFPGAEQPADVPETLALEEQLTIHHIRKALKDGNSYTLAATMRMVMNCSRQFWNTPNVDTPAN